MRTPFGFECQYFFGDYHRGRSVERCDLLSNNKLEWSVDLCKTCPVPGIRRANACDHMQLRAKVNRSLIALFMRRVQVTAFCEKTNTEVREPHVGCGKCHPLNPIFEVKK